ncbi:MAG: DUF4350 domain-containing protein [Steroidobacteraceae bacterium]|nr:DUF4350 domain-containing protein [Steroidobacteraceae bacterium]
MNRLRLIKIVALLAVVGLLALLGSRMEFVDVKVPAPLKGEARTNPFYAAIKFTEALGADASWERAFVAEPHQSVILVSSWNWTLSGSRRDRLRRWVENGGRLVVDSSLSGDLEEFETWTGIGETEADDDEVEAKEEADHEKGKEQPSATEAAVQKALDLRPCTSLSEDGSDRHFDVCDVQFPRSLEISRKSEWALRDGNYLHAVRVRVGKGSVTVLNADPFGYRDFLLGDHAQLLVAATQLHAGDEIAFLTEQDHASIVELMWRFGAPAVLLLAVMIALALWRSAARFGPLLAPPEAARRSLAEQIRGTGHFALRFGRGKSLHAAAARALRDAALKRQASYDRLSSEQRIAALVKLSDVPAEELRPALHFTGARSAHELRQAITVLETARRRILLKNKRAKHGN